MKRLIPLILFLLLMPSCLKAQNHDHLLVKINELLQEGQCESAQKLYNSWKQLEGKNDNAIEKSIASCKQNRNGEDHNKDGVDSSQRKNYTFTVNGVKFKMIFVEGGSFMMGCTGEQMNDCNCDTDYYYPAKLVSVSDYYIGETEVTQALWRAVMDADPIDHEGTMEKIGKGDNYPIYLVGGKAVDIFIERLNAQTGLQFRYPSNVEWEYAARGGNRSHHYKYSGGNNIDAVAWYSGNSGDMFHPVKTKIANELGIYDMTGNAEEFIPEIYAGFTLTASGGYWGATAEDCCLSVRQMIPSEYEEVSEFEVYMYGPSSSAGMGLRLVLERVK